MSAVATPSRSKPAKAKLATRQPSSVDPLGHAAAPAPNVAESTSAPSTKTFATTAWHRSVEAEAVLRTYAEEAGDDRSWAVLTITQAATAILDRTHDAPTAEDCQSASNYFAQAIEVGCLFADVDPSLLLDASLTILVLAKEILDKGVEEMNDA